MKNVKRYMPVISFFAGIMFTISLGLRSQDSSSLRKVDILKPEEKTTISVKPEKQRVIDAQADSLAAISDRLLKKPVLPEKEGKKLVAHINEVNTEARKVDRALDRMINSLIPKTATVQVRTVLPVINLVPIRVNPLPVDSIPVVVPETSKRTFLKRIFH